MTQQLLKKLKFNQPGVVIAAPETIAIAFKDLNYRDDWPAQGKSTNTLVFVNDKKQLLAFLKQHPKRIENDSVLWVAYPKGTSKMTTDINRDIIRNIAAEYGLSTVTAIAIDDTWSGLRLRPAERVGK